MKKFLATLLTTAMAVSLLTGCGGKGEPEAPEAPAQSEDAAQTEDVAPDAGEAEDAGQEEPADAEQTGSGSYAAYDAIDVESLRGTSITCLLYTSPSPRD